MVPEQATQGYTATTPSAHFDGAFLTKENIANYVRRCRNYMFAYLEGSAVGHELEEKIKFYKSASYTSHRRIGITV